IYEGSDMLYHLIVLLTSKCLSIEVLAMEIVVRLDPNFHKH
ncbi:MAG: bifunctional phosphoribosyl-AMP cyclohydrolase/phosphoribosyl-ATP diphosphatase, partial [Prevotellaceae bacterium]|nr:bifunctional phosphoribosyl-AMP cyclohydrolase/phosphoribosyl-ATP diphosphatase [Prevotellaceae bacterium]